MKLIATADVHLDTPFAWLPMDAARRRRENVRTAFDRIVRLASDRGVDALLIAGDLFENELVTPDTLRFLAKSLAQLEPIRVFIAPGNHDWYGPASPYALIDWSPNVHIYTEERLSPVQLKPGFTLWGAAHRRPAGTGDFLADFAATGAGVNLALFHGSERHGLPYEVEDKIPHAPFDASEIERDGIDHLVVGHYHRPRDEARYTYPGNPDPLTFGEEGDRGVVILEIGERGDIARERVDVAASRVTDAELDVSGCDHGDEVRERVRSYLASLDGTVRLSLFGELAPAVEVPTDFAGLAPQLEALVVRVTRLRQTYDIDAIRAQPTVAGEFARAASEIEDPEIRRRVIVTGLRAFEGRRDLDVT